MAKARSGVLGAAATAVLALAACGAPSLEQQLLRKFFEASRLYDRTALAELGTATFNPVTDGVVRDFEVAAVGSERLADSRPSKEVTVRARVHTLDGSESTRVLVVTLEKLKDRWTIADLRAAP